MNELTRRSLTLVAIATFLCGTGAPLSVAEDGQQTPRVALAGYDPVAYFVDGRPVKGSSAFSFTFDDAVYYFALPNIRRCFLPILIATRRDIPAIVRRLSPWG